MLHTHKAKKGWQSRDAKLLNGSWFEGCPVQWQGTGWYELRSLVRGVTCARKGWRRLRNQDIGKLLSAKGRPVEWVRWEELTDSQGCLVNRVPERCRCYLEQVRVHKHAKEVE